MDCIPLNHKMYRMAIVFLNGMDRIPPEHPVGVG